VTQSLMGRSVVVTGGSKGIGKGIARVFAQAGARVAIIARHADQAEAAANEIGHGAFGLAGDVTSLASMEGSMKAAAGKSGGIDVLCANAGIFPQTRLADLTAREIDEIFAINVKGCMLSVQAALTALAASGHGRVILTSSITGPQSGFPGWSHYGATKAAQLGFLKSAAIELAPMQITMNAVLPGIVETEGLEELGPEYRKAMEDSVPQGRLGTVEDIGNAALFFATDEAGYITGQQLVVDGGQILPEGQLALDAV
jgi:3-oxoacyl-[acyl-carrier protein] reductase